MTSNVDRLRLVFDSQADILKKREAMERLIIEGTGNKLLMDLIAKNFLKAKMYYFINFLHYLL